MSTPGPTQATPWTASSGFRLGLIAGLTMLVAEVVAAAVARTPVLEPIRMAASVLLGEAAFVETPLGVALTVGLLLHFSLSAVFGFLYAFLDARMAPEARVSAARQTATGMLYGLALWALNFQLIARFLYPWLLRESQFPQLVFHAVFFGLPLGLLFTRAERRRMARDSSSLPTPRRTGGS